MAVGWELHLTSAPLTWIRLEPFAMKSAQLATNAGALTVIKTKLVMAVDLAMPSGTGTSVTLKTPALDVNSALPCTTPNAKVDTPLLAATSVTTLDLVLFWVNQV